VQTTTTPTTTCPTWCVSDHQASTTLHFQADVTIPAMNGQDLPVAAFITDARQGVSIAGYELSPKDARELALVLLDRADLATEAAEDDFR